MVFLRDQAEVQIQITVLGMVVDLALSVLSQEKAFPFSTYTTHLCV